MKRRINLIVMLMVISTMAFAGLFDGVFGPSKEEIAEFRYTYAKQLLNEDVSTFRGKFLNLDQVIGNITDGVIIDDLLQHGSTYTPTTDIPLSIEEIPKWVSSEETIEVPDSMFTLKDTYVVKYLYNMQETRNILQSYPINTIPYSPETVKNIKECLISANMYANEAIRARVDGSILTLDEKSQEYKDLMKLKHIKGYYITYNETPETKSGVIVYDNNVVKVSIPYTYDKDGNYSANLDLSNAVVEVCKRDGVTNEFLDAERFVIPDMFDSAVTAKERLIGISTQRLTVNDSTHKEDLQSTNFFFLKEAYGEALELAKSK